MPQITVETTETTKILKSKDSKKSQTIRLATSTFLWILLTLCVVDIFIKEFRPLKFVHVAGLMLKDHDIVGCRVDQLLHKNSGVNTIVLGDSTADSACVYPDMCKFKVSLNSYSRYYYLDARFAQEQLRNDLKLPVSMRNLSFGGCLISDQLVMLKKLLKHGTPPKAALVMVVPRPFIDTTLDTKISPVSCYFENRFKELDKLKSLPEMAEYFLSRVSSIYRTRTDYNSVITAMACGIFNKAAAPKGHGGLNQENKVFMAGQEELINPYTKARPDWVKQEDAHYKKAYLFNNKTYAYQYACFEEMLSILKKNSITAVLVKMPLDYDNRKLLPSGFDQEFWQDIEQSAEQKGIAFIDMERDNRFDKNDFLDNVHLNGPGSIKFWQLLSGRISKDKELMLALSRSLK